MTSLRPLCSVVRCPPSCHLCAPSCRACNAFPPPIHFLAPIRFLQTSLILKVSQTRRPHHPPGRKSTSERHRCVLIQSPLTILSSFVWPPPKHTSHDAEVMGAAVERVEKNVVGGNKGLQACKDAELRAVTSLMCCSLHGRTAGSIPWWRRRRGGGPIRERGGSRRLGT